MAMASESCNNGDGNHVISSHQSAMAAWPIVSDSSPWHGISVMAWPQLASWLASYSVAQPPSIGPIRMA